MRFDMHLPAARDQRHQTGNVAAGDMPRSDRAQPVKTGRGQRVCHESLQIRRVQCQVPTRSLPYTTDITGSQGTAVADSRRDGLAVEAIDAELRRAIRYDDESIVHSRWVRQRYDCGCYPSLAPARQAAVRTAWHEAGHAVAALAVGARFSSASIHHGHRSEGRVHGIAGAHADAFVVDAAGQIAERLMNWTMLERDDELRELASQLAAGRRRRPPVPPVHAGAVRRRRGRGLAALRGGPDAAAAGDTAARQGAPGPPAASALQRGHGSQRTS